MSIQTLHTAASGMTAMESKLDVIANNLANSQTTGFKSDRANFEDLFYHQATLPGSEVGGVKTAVGTAYGNGVRVQSTQTNFKQGTPDQTGNRYDMSIQGDGFFQVTDPAGETFYTRAGNFSLNADGAIVLGSASTGRLIEPPITIPTDAVEVVISPDGIVSVKQAGSANVTQQGQIQIADFPNPAGLVKLGENLFSESDASGSPVSGNPGQTGLGSIQQRTLESSNVEPVQELIDLIVTQRAFEMNSEAIQAGDQMLQLVSNLRRG